MARPCKPVSIPAFQRSNKPIVYAEGRHEYKYLTKLVARGLIQDYQQGTKLSASEVVPRIKTIERDMADDAVDVILWIVDGSDRHIKNSKPFHKFYNEWLRQHSTECEWKKLHILINTPDFEYWALLHRIDPPLDKKGKPIYFTNATDLEDSPQFTEHCPEGKGANLVKAIAENELGRKNAIQRAKNLSLLLDGVPGKKKLQVARAEIYRIFEIIPVTIGSSFSVKSAQFFD